MREYEACFVIHPRVDEAGIEQEIGAVTGVISAGGGELVGVHKWGRRKMAYPVQKVRDGYYVLVRFQGESGVLSELDRRFKLNESVLRHLVVRAADDEFPPDLRAREPRRGLRGEGPPRGRRREDADDVPLDGPRGRTEAPTAPAESAEPSTAEAVATAEPADVVAGVAEADEAAPEVKPES